MAEQQTKRAAYLGDHQWKSSLVTSQMLPIVTEWGWKQEGNAYIPVWTMLPIASKACKEFIKCGCKKGCAVQCKCHKNKLRCTELCKCRGECRSIVDSTQNENTSNAPDISFMDVAHTDGETLPCSHEALHETIIVEDVSGETMECTESESIFKTFIEFVLDIY